MDPMNNDSENIELRDPVNSFSISSIVHPECSIIGVSCYPDSCWIPSTGNFVSSFFQFFFITVSHSAFEFVCCF